MTSELNQLFVRDLGRLQTEIENFQNESNIWKTTGTVSNSAGHLTLHLCGNLRHFIGHVLGGSEYIRNRTNEFSSSPISVKELCKEIEITKAEVIKTLANIDSKILSQNFPVNVFKKEMTTAFFLIHLQGHLNYHLGQINYLKKTLE